jgi:hypothetical protein
MSKSSIIAVAATGLGLAACTSSPSWMPSVDLFKSKPTTATLSIESSPPGAEARTSQGGTCRTPCTQEVSLAGGEITVSYALNGYLPASVTVRPGPPDATTALLDPNPVFAELRPATAPKPPPPKKKRRPKAPPAPAAVEAAPPPQTGFAPPPGAFTPVTPR